MSDWIEHDGKKYFEEAYLEQANEAARRVRQERDEARAHVVRLREALGNPAVIFETEYAESFALEVLAETPAQSLEAIRAEAKREAQREMQSSTFGELVKGCETLSHRIESHEWDNMPVWAQRDWLIQQTEILHQHWTEKWRRTLDREADGKERIRVEAGRERSARELRELADSSCHTIELYTTKGFPYLEPTVLCRRLRQRADEIEAGL